MTLSLGKEKTPAAPTVGVQIFVCQVADLGSVDSRNNNWILRGPSKACKLGPPAAGTGGPESALSRIGHTR